METASTNPLANLRWIAISVDSYHIAYRCALTYIDSCPPLLGGLKLRKSKALRSFRIRTAETSRVSRTKNAVTQFDIQGLVNQWTKNGLAQQTVRLHYAIAIAIFSYAQRSHFIGRSPCRMINLTRVVDEQLHQYSATDVESLSNSLAPRYALMVYFGAVLGMR